QAVLLRGAPGGPALPPGRALVLLARGDVPHLRARRRAPGRGRPHGALRGREGAEGGARRGVLRERAPQSRRGTHRSESWRGGRRNGARFGDRRREGPGRRGGRPPLPSRGSSHGARRRAGRSRRAAHRAPGRAAKRKTVRAPHCLVVLERPADLTTPVALMRGLLAGARPCFLLESVEGG